MFKRGYHGTYHKMSMKHLPRYISEFSRRHNDRVLDTMAQMKAVARNMGARRLPREQLMSGPPAWPQGEKEGVGSKAACSRNAPRTPRNGHEGDFRSPSP